MIIILHLLLVIAVHHLILLVAIIVLVLLLGADGKSIFDLVSDDMVLEHHLLLRILHKHELVLPHSLRLLAHILLSV